MATTSGIKHHFPEVKSSKMSEAGSTLRTATNKTGVQRLSLRKPWEHVFRLTNEESRVRLDSMGFRTSTTLGSDCFRVRASELRVRVKVKVETLWIRESPALRLAPTLYSSGTHRQRSPICTIRLGYKTMISVAWKEDRAVLNIK